MDMDTSMSSLGEVPSATSVGAAFTSKSTLVSRKASSSSSSPSHARSSVISVIDIRTNSTGSFELRSPRSYVQGDASRRKSQSPQLLGESAASMSSGSTINFVDTGSSPAVFTTSPAVEINAPSSQWKIESISTATLGADFSVPRLSQGLLHRQSLLANTYSIGLSPFMEPRSPGAESSASLLGRRPLTGGGGGQRPRTVTAPNPFVNPIELASSNRRKRNAMSMRISHEKAGILNLWMENASSDTASNLSSRPLGDPYWGTLLVEDLSSSVSERDTRRMSSVSSGNSASPPVMNVGWSESYSSASEDDRANMVPPATLVIDERLLKLLSVQGNSISDLSLTSKSVQDESVASYSVLPEVNSPITVQHASRAPKALLRTPVPGDYKKRPTTPVSSPALNSRSPVTRSPGAHIPMPDPYIDASDAAVDTLFFCPPGAPRLSMVIPFAPKNASRVLCSFWGDCLSCMRWYFVFLFLLLAAQCVLIVLVIFLHYSGDVRRRPSAVAEVIVPHVWIIAWGTMIWYLWRTYRPLVVLMCVLVMFVPLVAVALSLQLAFLYSAIDAEIFDSLLMPHIYGYPFIVGCALSIVPLFAFRDRRYFLCINGIGVVLFYFLLEFIYDLSTRQSSNVIRMALRIALFPILVELGIIAVRYMTRLSFYSSSCGSHSSWPTLKTVVLGSFVVDAGFLCVAGFFSRLLIACIEDFSAQMIAVLLSFLLKSALVALRPWYWSALQRHWRRICCVPCSPTVATSVFDVYVTTMLFVLQSLIEVVNILLLPVIIGIIQFRFDKPFFARWFLTLSSGESACVTGFSLVLELIGASVIHLLYRRHLYPVKYVLRSTVFSGLIIYLSVCISTLFHFVLISRNLAWNSWVLPRFCTLIGEGGPWFDNNDEVCRDFSSKGLQSSLLYNISQDASNGVTLLSSFCSCAGFRGGIAILPASQLFCCHINSTLALTQ